MGAMNIRIVMATLGALAVLACSPAPREIQHSSNESLKEHDRPPPPPPAPAPTASVASSSATASAAPSSSGSASSGSASPAPAASGEPVVTTTAVTAVSNEITTPSVVTPDKVIGTLRPKLNACYQDGLKKDPKLAGSVTLSAKIEKDGKVSAVTPKVPEGLSPAVIKCLSDTLMAANFAASGGINYATSLDIPLRFSSN